ncbi:hypothetical protein BDZ45DRAFT_438003 [Acephala macrosclerotiorum]|nr:hypothetical protein BDZ45DRAFT_438003 [Acephala macrosclerotiorum]
MRKHLKKLRKLFSKDGRATTPPGTPSESTNASPSNLTERHVPPDLPTQVGSTNAGPQLVTTPTVQAISIASLAHAAKTHVPPPVPPVADPPTEPDPGAEEREPVIKPTKRQAQVQPSDEETPQDSSGLLRPRPSCWDKAAESLQVARPDVYTKLEKIKSRHKNRSQSDPAGLLVFAESKMRENKGIPRVIETTIRSILQFKEIVAAAANFDPHRIAPTVWRGFCVVLESFY